MSGEIQRPHRADILRRILRARAQPVRVRVRGRNRDHLERAVPLAAQLLEGPSERGDVHRIRQARPRVVMLGRQQREVLARLQEVQGHPADGQQHQFAECRM